MPTNKKSNAHCAAADEYEAVWRVPLPPSMAHALSVDCPRCTATVARFSAASVQTRTRAGRPSRGATTSGHAQRRSVEPEPR